MFLHEEESFTLNFLTIEPFKMKTNIFYENQHA